MNFSPLEQFEVSLYFFDFTAIFLCFDVILISYFFFFIILFLILSMLFFFDFLLVPSVVAFIFSEIYKFLFSLVLQQSGIAGLRYLPVGVVIFFFILGFNLLGLFPFGFCVTSHLSVTLSLALSLNIFLLFLGFKLHRFKFLKLFVPSGVPLLLLSLIVIIEFVSYLLRTISLSVRLFANMMAGHTLLHILSSFVILLLDEYLDWFSLVPFFFVVLVYFLEFGIAFLQAYVFTVLFVIYLNDALRPGH
jgi:ATP synthase subunit 6